MIKRRKKDLRIVVACTGAGGHLVAGLAIAQALKNKLINVNLFFLGSRNSRAKELTTIAGFPYYSVLAAGLQAKSLWQLIKFVISQLLALGQSIGLLLFQRPDLVISTGGFASVGASIGCRLLKIPFLIHEQNIVPGKANKFCSRWADRILISFSETNKYFGGLKCLVTGMPLRKLQRLLPQQARINLGLNKNRFTVLVVGGSKGSHQINELIIAALNKLDSLQNRIQFIHLAGEDDYKSVAESYRSLGFSSLVKEYTLEMDLNYSAADLVISRSGSSVVNEIIYFGLPAILIPYPYSADKHQALNAKLFSDQAAAVVLNDKEINADRLVKEINLFIADPGRGKQMAKRSAALVKPDAAEKIAEEVLDLINYKKLR